MTSTFFGKSGGCLSSYGEGKPHYDFTQNERDALSVFLQKGQEALQHREPIEFAHRQMKNNQCMNCHSRDEKSSNWKSPHTLPSALPPSLTHTGEKLHGDFLSKILKGDLNEKMRPWMKAKMPSFPKEAELLATGLNASHGFSASENETVETQEGDVGAALILQNGFACIVCHAAGSQEALAPFGAPGPNLGLAAERLRHEYYLRWMLNPQRAEPSTHMTKFSSDHVKTAVQAFDGDAQKQFNAIWDYIQTLK
jgi:mono/diheme cytochrome c family protein